MASWLFGISKLKSENVEPTEPQDPQPAVTIPQSNPKSVPNQTPWPQLPYMLKSNDIPQHELKGVEETTDEMKLTSMLDSVPFVLSKEINAGTNDINYNLENTRKCLSSVKEFLESDVYNYDFSNDRRLHTKMTKNNGDEPNGFIKVPQKNDIQWLHRICFNIFHKDKEK